MSILTFGVTKEQIAADLRTHNLCLPLQTAQTESRLLAEAGRHTITMVDGSKKTYDFPACCRGQECTGMTSNLPGFTAETPGVVLTTMMFENEYEEFLRTGVYAAEPRHVIIPSVCPYYVPFLVFISNIMLPLTDHVCFACVWPLPISASTLVPFRIACIHMITRAPSKYIATLVRSQGVTRLCFFIFLLPRERRRCSLTAWLCKCLFPILCSGSSAAAPHTPKRV